MREGRSRASSASEGFPAGLIVSSFTSRLLDARDRIVVYRKTRRPISRAKLHFARKLQLPAQQKIIFFFFFFPPYTGTAEILKPCLPSVFIVNNCIASSWVSSCELFTDFLNTRLSQGQTNLINRELELVTILHVFICSPRSVSSIFRVLIRQIAAIVRAANRLYGICRRSSSAKLQDNRRNAAEQNVHPVTRLSIVVIFLSFLLLFFFVLS